ncbi:cytochrome C peroxidase [Sulfurimonas hongkongensis]|uniref:Cytochrome C peroxidase n=1 Tax=Sulfurimonas hongkongensis TaxID=1172190 RepID=T0KQX7_9BACT|nr:cytochrome c peroxidase [Sulfurimonas hongkongensis]EQB39469.1 cytochrome C peroxidase [Sulfurimonas hongkongensis]
MRFFIGAFAFIVLLLFSVSLLLPTKEKRIFSDDGLREAALSRDMSSTPNNYEELLKLLKIDKDDLFREKVELGRDLYFEKKLSNSSDISCATCHVLSKDLKDKNIFIDALISEANDKTDCVVCHLSDQSATDRFETSIGDGGRENPFHLNTLTTLNAALAKYQTWDGSVKSVEEQVGLSIKDASQMNLSADEAVARLSQDENYAKRFQEVYGELDFKNIEDAIAAYLKTLITRGDYDRFLDGDNKAMSTKAKKGLAHFLNFGCKGCHTGVSVGGQSIQKFPLRDYNSVVDVTNSFNESQKGREVATFDFNAKMYHPFPFENKGGFMGKDGERLFRVPMLRNVTKTSPYFHNGGVAKLREAVHLMGKHQLGMNLTNTQIDEIVEFLRALEGSVVEFDIPSKKGEV